MQWFFWKKSWLSGEAGKSNKIFIPEKLFLFLEQDRTGQNRVGGAHYQIGQVGVIEIGILIE